MSYLKSSLVRGERIVFRARHHWSMTVRVVFWTIVWLVLPAVLFLTRGPIGRWGADAVQNSDGSRPVTAGTLAMILGGIAVLVALLNIWGTISYFLWKHSCEYAVTTRRVVMKEGLIRRNAFDVQLTQVESARVHQGLFGRMLGYGALTVTATGGSSGRWPMIENPLRFKRAIETVMGGEQATQDERAEGTAREAAPAPDDGGPGEFRVEGVEKESQEDAEIVVKARSLANARVKAEMSGIVVTSVQRVASEPEPESA
ncbi:MAG: PH domain-containing protein [Phycisphaerales bacterium]